MKPERIDIQKPLYAQSGSWGVNHQGSSEAGQEGESDPPAHASSPLGGFWIRLAAFLLDGALLYMVARSWSGLGRDFFLDHPHLQLPLAIGIYLAYFALLNGPVGQGRTAGKWMLGLVTRGGDGQPLRGTTAWVRTVAQCGPLLSLWFTDSLLVAFPNPGSAQSVALFYASTLVGIPALAFLILNAASIAFRPDKRAIHDLLAGAFVCKKDRTESALETLGAIPAEAIRKSWTAITVLTLCCFGFLEYQNISVHPEEKAYSAFMESFWKDHGLEGYQAHTPRLGILSNYARADGPQDASAALVPRDIDTATTDTTYRLAYPVIYFRTGRVDDEALLKTIDADNLTTAVADWIHTQRHHPVISEPLETLRSRLEESGAQVSCDAVVIQFYEVLRLPWYLGPQYSRRVAHAIHTRAIMPAAPEPTPASHPHSEPYRGQ